MVQGRARLKEFGLRAEMMWASRQYASLKTKVLREQGKDESERDGSQPEGEMVDLLMSPRQGETSQYEEYVWRGRLGLNKMSM